MLTKELSKFIDYDLSLIDKRYDDTIYVMAKEMRIDLAQELFERLELLELDSIDIEVGMLKSILERNPYENTRQLLQFNTILTRELCSKILRDQTLPIIDKVALYSFVIELGAREFISPVDAKKIYVHLSAAKDKGFFFTPPSVALRMIALSLKYNEKAESVFDPACGSGIFLAYSAVFNKNIKSVYGIELDKETAYLAEKLIRQVCEEEDIEIDINIKCGDFFEFLKDNPDKKYDLVVMNPPYGSVKFLASDLTDVSTKTGLSVEERAELSNKLRKETIEYATKLRKQFEKYGIGRGTLEYSKLFMAAIHEMLEDNGYMVSITPSAWLGDASSVAFRKVVIKNGYLNELWIIPEKAKLFKGVNQPTAITVMGKKKSPAIIFSNPVLKIEDGEKNASILELKSVLAVSGETFKFPKCNKESLSLLVKLQSKGRLNEISNLVNARGELDLTAGKRFVSKLDTGHRLIRGDHIANQYLKEADESEKAGYVLFDEFIHFLINSKKLKYIEKRRIAIAQCSYLQKSKRIEAAIVPRDSVISNSCNFIALEDKDDMVKIFYYWIILNSNVVEWEFRIFSYNNHVANTEIDSLTCIPYENLDKDVQKQLDKYYLNNGKTSEYELDAFVAYIYGLSIQEYKEVLVDVNAENMDYYLKEYVKMQLDKAVVIPQHEIPSLSALDKLMIGYVEPGGNWTSIPESVPSKRLDQIREMAKTRGMVRTTYYSRLKYNQPAYTISTYFNRPGNGANIHPWENRTLSSREAARLQSFPDSFVFKGTDAAIRTQIGNAVPPLLGYAIGKAITKKLGRNVSFCDLFAGAGGLSYGLELAGFKGIAALELDKFAAETFAINHNKNMHTIVGDINSEEIQNELIKTIQDDIKENEPWVLVGGPPCQGFSTAGYRDENDIRNKLVDTYLKIIEKVKPTVVVMENVQGILSMSKGQVIKGIYEALGKLGYHCTPNPWVVDAERYGVPQMRKRVIIVAAKEKEHLPDYPEPIFSKCLGRREQKDMQLEFSFDSYPITVGEAFWDLPPLMPINEYYPKEARIDSTYSRWCKGEISTEELLNNRGRI